ncbi:MAG: hypothetical protein AB7S44_04215 [Spirochaetales bacterium]
MNNKENLNQLIKLIEEKLEDEKIELNLHRPEIDVINNRYFEIVKKIQAILNNDDLDDFLKVDEIVKLLLKNGLDTHCHDFG